jgi:hypothetical protein
LRLAQPPPLRDTYNRVLSSEYYCTTQNSVTLPEPDLGVALASPLRSVKSGANLQAKIETMVRASACAEYTDIITIDKRIEAVLQAQEDKCCRVLSCVLGLFSWTTLALSACPSAEERKLA